MDRFGFIHEKLDIKILILFILRRLPGVVDRETLGELCQCDNGIAPNFISFPQFITTICNNVRKRWLPSTKYIRRKNL